jgi:predicted HicB family RNase H-like nuclease
MKTTEAEPERKTAEKAVILTVRISNKWNDYIHSKAQDQYMSVAEYVRNLIRQDMLKSRGSEGD